MNNVQKYIKSPQSRKTKQQHVLAQEKPTHFSLSWMAKGFPQVRQMDPMLTINVGPHPMLACSAPQYTARRVCIFWGLQRTTTHCENSEKGVHAFPGLQCITLHSEKGVACMHSQDCTMRPRTQPLPSAGATGKTPERNEGITGMRYHSRRPEYCQKLLLTQYTQFDDPYVWRNAASISTFILLGTYIRVSTGVHDWKRSSFDTFLLLCSCSSRVA